MSLFVEPEIEVMEAARDLGAPVVELHTGTYCDVVAEGDAARDEIDGACGQLAAVTPAGEVTP